MADSRHSGRRVIMQPNPKTRTGLFADDLHKSLQNLWRLVVVVIHCGGIRVTGNADAVIPVRGS